MAWFLVFLGCLIGAALSGADGSLLLGVVIGGLFGRLIALFVHLGRREAELISKTFTTKKPPRESVSFKPQQFTERAATVLQAAKEEARRWNHDFLATEHLLLALCQTRSGTLKSVLHDLFIPDDETLRAEIARFLPPGSETFTLEDGLAQTPRFVRVLKRAVEFAAETGCRLVDAEHLFYALLEESDGIAVRVLAGYTADFEDARQLVLHHLTGAMSYGTTV